MRFLYPDFRTKALTFSYDDGVKGDIHLLEKHGGKSGDFVF